MIQIDILKTPIIALVALLGACSTGASVETAAPAPENDGPRIVQPGAPGQSSRTFSSTELDQVEGVSYTDADVSFMQGMIPHHQQALEMTALVRQHAVTEAVQRMALRMEISQRDEIALISAWLADRGETIEMSNMGAMQHEMMGMLTPEQMQTLSETRGMDFDRLFLEGMIQHHRGALAMVTELFSTSGAAQESTIFKFAEEIDADQLMEIERMQGLLNQMAR
ncbi:MAG TPA: DUF305 domain-containing protein [Gemmatimonadetes bacterium]|nr:DUF305 domain-containing protein [Gemmatimonadota bacterium]HCW78436.1 DUF305 domain-containing protein [Gemmatimonadota bacterium]|tara:strand:- start:32 stop:703 length:672 start_codon:yes stop_codon:yes gene_type:complete